MCGDSRQNRSNKQAGLRPISAQSILSPCKCDCQVVKRVSKADREQKKVQANQIDSSVATGAIPSV